MNSKDFSNRISDEIKDFREKSEKGPQMWTVRVVDLTPEQIYAFEMALMVAGLTPEIMFEIIVKQIMKEVVKEDFMRRKAKRS